MAIQMRRGQEVNFDADKMLPGEWAVSLDTKYVRMCFAPGVCVRMATYDAFEMDMAKIEAILAECQTIEEVVTRINSEVSANAKAVAEYTEQAKQYRDEAKLYKEQASAIVGVDIANKTVPGLMAGGENAVDNGVLTLTKTTTSRTLTESYPGGLKINSIDGESQQKQYSGKNLWSFGNVSGTLSASKTFALKPAKYTISSLVTSSDANTSNCLVQIFFEDNTSTSLYFARNVRTSQTVTFAKNVRAINFYASNNYANSEGDTFSFEDIQIEEGSTMTDYEPFVGNQPSPNPTYPQSIDSVEMSEIWTHGKNYWNLGDVSGTLSVAKGFKLKAGTYAISALVTSSDTDATTCLLQISCEDGTKKSLYFEKNSRQSKNITLTSNATTFNFYASTDYSKSQGDTFSFKDIQIEKGSVATDFEEFKETKEKLSKSIILRGIGDAKDVLVKKDGVYCTDRKIVEIGSYNGETIKTNYISTTGGLDIGANIIYVANTPTFEPLPLVDQIALHKLETFGGVTYLFTDSTIEPIIEVEYATSKVGGYALGGYQKAEANRLLLEQLNTLTNELATQLVAGSEA